MAGPPISDGAVRVEEKKIAEVGPFDAISRKDEIVDLGACALLPGLINAHCHLDYTCLRGKISRQNSFTDWIRAINAEKVKLTTNEYVESIRAGITEAKRFGTTAIVNVEAFPELIAQFAGSPLRIWWCPELIDVSAPDRSHEIFRQAIMAIQASLENSRAGAGLAPHALFTASAELFRECAAAAANENWIFTTHVGESREEMEMFRDAAGPLFNFLQTFGRPMQDCGNSTPLSRFLSIVRDPSTSHATAGSAQDDGARPGELNRRTLIAHLNELVESDFELLSQLPGKFCVAHCPRSHAYFRHSTFQFERLRELGFNICLGTDSLASNENLSLFAEMREFRSGHPNVSADEIFRMVTTNPARVLNFAGRLGTIGAAALADMIAVPIPVAGDTYEAILNFKGEVPWMMIEGEVQ